MIDLNDIRKDNRKAVCKVCKQIKTRADFNISKSGIRHRSDCKVCQAHNEKADKK